MLFNAHDTPPNICLQLTISDIDSGQVFLQRRIAYNFQRVPKRRIRDPRQPCNRPTVCKDTKWSRQKTAFTKMAIQFFVVFLAFR